MKAQIKERMKRTVDLIIVFIFAMIFAGCTVPSDLMKQVGPDVLVIPGSNSAVIVFMRPSPEGASVQPSIFDVTTDENIFIGIVPSKTKVAYSLPVGEYMFMVVDKSADFMDANVEAGKTYYVVVTPRTGIWKTRFTLDPVHKDETYTDQFNTRVDECQYIESTDRALEWARDNAEKIRSKREKNSAMWLRKPEDQHPVLHKEDGI